MSKHDQNRTEKRERLIRAGLDAFTETGFDNTTVSDVVRRAGMTPSTFYNYYRDKEALLTEVLDRTAVDLLAGLKTVRRDASDVDDFVRRCCRALLEGLAGDRAMSSLVKRNLSLVRSLLDHEKFTPVYAAIQRDIDAAIAAGFLGAIDTGYATALIRSTALEVTITLLSRGDSDLKTATDFSATAISGALQALSGANARS
ncbi:MAG: AcrR family transcriptional regulator [Hyphomicrobiaceae bacterium]